MIEQEIADGRRAFPETQRLFEGESLRLVGNGIAVGWYDTSVSSEEPGFALVRSGAGLDDLVGEVLIVSNGDRRIFVYCLALADLPTDIAVTRRAFSPSLGVLALESLDCTVEVRA